MYGNSLLLCGVNIRDANLSVSHSQWKFGWCVVDRDSTENAKMILDFYSVNSLVR
jgi:hypothetical protein